MVENFMLKETNESRRIGLTAALRREFRPAAGLRVRLSGDFGAVKMSVGWRVSK
jgi:hypothetical protein